MRATNTLRTIGLMLAWTAPLCALGALGEAPVAAGSVAALDARVARHLPVQAAQAYKQHALELSNGTSVQEFADLQGRVFAVRWSGPDLPDLGMLLGNYLPVFKASVQSARQAGKRGGPVWVQSGGLVLLSTGVMGAFRGYAYLEGSVPPGVDVRALVQ